MVYKRGALIESPVEFHIVYSCSTRNALLVSHLVISYYSESDGSHVQRIGHEVNHIPHVVGVLL
jgi:hypothetical protein